MRKLLLTASSVLGMLAVLQLAARGQELELTDSRYQQLLQEVRPPEDALWRTVPWKTSLLDAQRQAADEAKPIFIWAMDGHPLGCT